MPTVQEFGRMSQAEFDLYRQQFRQRIKSLSPEDRQSVLERSQTESPNTQLSPSLGKTDAPLWQSALETISKPFELIQEHVFTPLAAGVQAPAFEEGIQPWQLLGPLGALAAYQPGQEGREEYEKWMAPTWETGLTTPHVKVGSFEMGGGPLNISTKNILEEAPWFAIPTGAGVAARMGKVAQAGGRFSKAASVAEKVAKPVAAVEKAVTYPISKPLEILSEKIAPKFTKLFAAPSNEMIEKQLTNVDWQKKVAQWFGRKPVGKQVVELLGGKAATVGSTQAVEDVTARALLIGARVQETLLNHRAVGLAKLRGLHPDPVNLFGIDEATGFAKITAKDGFKGASKHINDIAEHPHKYNLTPTQKGYIDEIHKVEDLVLEAMKKEGIDVNLLKFDEFSHWVHRVVKGKVVDGKLVEVSKGMGRIGSKQSFEKTRFYDTALEGIENGLVYSPNLEQSLDLYIQSAAKKIADKRIADMVAPFGAKPLERAYAKAAPVMEEARKTAAQLGAAKNLIKATNRAIRGEKLPENTISAIERKLPELGKELRAAGADKTKLKSLLTKAKKTEQSAKEPYWVAKSAKAKTMEMARTPSYGTEATIQHPAFQGKIFPVEVADEITKYWADKGFKPLQVAAQISGEMRTLVAAADFSAMFIQGLPGIFKHPKAWAQGAVMSFKAFKNPANYQKYLVKETQNITDRVYAGGYAGGFEYMEAMGALQRQMGKVAGRTGKEAVRQSYGRFEAAFGSFGDVARNEMWKALKGSTKNADELAELARHLDRMTGVMSMKGIGIGASQRDFEAAFLFFAPRYTRAGFALIGDVFKGGLTGRETRKALGSMMAGGMALYVGTCAALGQEPELDPSTGRFMTVKITDPLTGNMRHFGVGGMMTSLIRFGADAAATTIENPEDLFIPFKNGQLNRFDNPFIKFMFSKSAPLTGFMTGMIEGKNYFGEPFENMGDYMKFMGEQVLPIAVQQTVMEEGGATPTGLIGEMAGMRTFPRSDWEKRDDLRDKLALDNFGVDWDTLGKTKGELYQRQLEQNPELKEAMQRARESGAKMARGEGKVWDEWRKDGDAVESMYRDSIMLASKEYEAIGDGVTFREKVNEIAAIRRAQYKAREQNPDYAEVYQFFNEPFDPKEAKDMHPLDVARKTYYDMMYTDDIYDQYGNYLFDEAKRREKLFLDRFGQQSLDYVKEFMGAKWDEPMSMKVLREAQTILKPYWEIESQVWSKYDPQLRQIAEQIKILEQTDPRQAKMIAVRYPQILMARKMIAQYKKMLKMRNPDIQWALDRFY